LRELERTEPTSYRNAYIMMGIATILIIALFMVVDVSFAAALLFLVSTVIVGFVATRAYSLVGFVVPAGSDFYLGPMKMLLGGGVGGGTREWYVMMSLGTVTIVEPITSGGGLAPFATSLGTYQMASANRVSTKSVFKIMLFVSILAPVIALVGDIWGMYTLGVTHLPGVSWSSGAYSAVTPEALANRPAYEPWWPQMLAGTVFAMLLSIMHARFVWFPLEPIGFLLATDGHALIEGIWTMALVAWIAKTITLRVGGSKLYERSGIPVAIGFIIGLVIITIVGGALLDFRFIDVHMHVVPKHSFKSEPITNEVLLRRMAELGIEKAVILPEVSPEGIFYYCTTETALSSCKDFPDKLIPFCNIDPRCGGNSPDTDFRWVLSEYKEAGCRGLGEVTANIYLDDPRALNLFKQCGGIGFPVLFHMGAKIGGVYGPADEIGMPRLEKALSSLPETTFIGHAMSFWAEISSEVDPSTRGEYPGGPIRSPGRLQALLSRYDNLYGDLSAGSGFNAISRDPEYGPKFLEDFQDKLLFGTDIYFVNEEAPIAEYLRNLVGHDKISMKAFRKISQDNIRKLINI